MIDFMPLVSGSILFCLSCSWQASKNPEILHPIYLLFWKPCMNSKSSQVVLNEG